MTKYVFPIRPTDTPDGTPNILPKEWWLRGALGPLAILEASNDGLRIIQRSLKGAVAQVAVGSALGLGVGVTAFVSTALLIVGRLGATDASVLLWALVAPFLALVPIVFLSPHIRKLAAWDPQGPFVRIQVRFVSLGGFHQELTIEGEGHEVRVQTNARRAAMIAALRLANQMPPSGLAPFPPTETVSSNAQMICPNCGRRYPVGMTSFCLADDGELKLVRMG